MFVSLLLGLAVVASSLAAPRPQWSQDQDIQDLNEVWTAEIPSRPYKHYDRFSFKTLIKALARFNSGAKSQLEYTEATMSPSSPFSQEQPDADLSASVALDASELLGVATPGPLEDDALNIKPIVKPDKSYRFTHNFRFGYGALPGLP